MSREITVPSPDTPAKEYSMKTGRTLLVLSIALLPLSVATAQAADRVNPGEWEITIGDGAPGTTMKSCVTAAHASVANGDDKTFQEALAKSAAEVGCTVKEVKVSGNQVTINSVCGGEQNINTTTYHGDWYEQVNSNGVKVLAKRIGACP
jgi:hypothetical protein